MEPFFNPERCDRWPDYWSPHCPLVLQSMIPALVHKALQLCNSTQCRGHNIRGLVLGFGYKHYKWEWSHMLRLRALHLESLCNYHSLKAWALEGASFAVSLGRGGGCLLSAKSFSEDLWVWVTEHLRCLSVPDTDYVFLTLLSFCSCLSHCVLQSAHCTHTLCTLHALHIAFALCTLHAPAVHTARTNCAYYTARTHCAHCPHAMCTLRARIVHTARTRRAHCAHALCTQHVNPHCAHCTHTWCTLHAHTVNIRTVHTDAFCIFHTRTVNMPTVHTVRMHCAHCTVFWQDLCI